MMQVLTMLPLDIWFQVPQDRLREGRVRLVALHQLALQRSARQSW